MFDRPSDLLSEPLSELPLEPAPGLRNHATLALCALLHAFTHAFGTMLVPLYILMARDLGLKSVRAASAVVTVYGLVYFLGSYPAGVLADRFNRKALLGIGLLGNALAIACMGLTRSYEMIMVCGILAGLFGTLFHPAANALTTAHYPKNPGMAIGLLGIGAGLGFFAGPQFAGWRAETAHWHWGAIGDWQRPLVEAGLAGVVFGIIFLFIAREAHSRKSNSGNGKRVSHPLGATLRWRVTRVAAVLGCRDFAGVASMTLVSIYLQKAHGLDAKRTGFIVGSMMLMSMIINPIAVFFSPGKRRLPVLSIALICGGLVLATVPTWPLAYVLPVLMVFQAFQLGSYAISDAAMLERVPAEIRGRVVGLFLTVAGTFSSIAPFVVAWWTDHLKERAQQPAAYLPIFASLAVMMIIASACSPLIAKLGLPQGPAIEPFTETMPSTVEPML